MGVPGQKIAISIEEAAQRTSLGRSFIWNAVMKGDLPSYRLGRRRLVRVADLDRWIRSHKASPGGTLNRTEEETMRRNEVDFAEAQDMLGVPEDVLSRMAEEQKLKSRQANGTIYFLRDEIEDLVDRQIEEGWAQAEL